MEIADLKKANVDTQNLLTTKTTPSQTMSYHISTAHFNAMIKPSDTLFDETTENWPAFEHHLLTEAENPTISWNQDITNYQPNENSKPFNFRDTRILCYSLTTKHAWHIPHSKNLKLHETFAKRYNITIDYYHADNGAFRSEIFQKSIDNNNQRLNFSGVDAQWQNGLVERSNITICAAARSMLNHAIS
jgi:hypothetical protein